MKRGNKSDKGCSGTTCGKCHPTLCPKSLDLRCLDRQCPWKLHTHRCMRAVTGDRRGGVGDQGKGDWVKVVGNGRGFRGGNSHGGQGHGGTGHGHGGQGNVAAGQHRQGAGNQRLYRQKADRAGKYRQGGVGVPPHSANVTQPNNWNNLGFQGLTAQQHLLGTLEQQLQQAVTRAIMQALSGAIPGLGGRMMGSVPHSS